jgi:hypothetical protein
VRVDLVDRGPLTTPRDPIRPLAVALAAGGHSVRLLSPDVLDAKAFPGVETLALRGKLRPGPRGRAALAKTLGSLLDPAVAATVLPFELAGLTPTPGPIAVLPPIDATPEDRGGSGWLDRFFAHRAARREEGSALARARWILAPGEEERSRFLSGAPGAAARTAVLPAAVPDPPTEPDRAGARRLLHLPDDVPVAASGRSSAGPRSNGPGCSSPARGCCSRGSPPPTNRAPTRCPGRIRRRGSRSTGRPTSSSPRPPST